jgi:NADPH-dependent curcumin reductase CurA
MSTATDTVQSREVRLAERPTGEPTAQTFTLATATVGPPGEGEVLVRTTLMSVEPYMRGRMNAGRSYVPPFGIGEPLSGSAVGEVIASRAGDIPVGSTVLHDLGWREYAVVPATRVKKIDVSSVPADAYLGAFGVPGFTAWVGLRIIAEVKAGQVLFVSGAAGAVGSMAVQLAKRAGLTVVGSASSPQKAAYVRDELGADFAFDYHDGPTKKLRELVPDGIDVYFDNVGGEQLEAAMIAMRDFGTVVLCGAVSQYNATAPEGPRTLGIAIQRRLKLQGFIVIDHFKRYDEFIAEVAPLIAKGEIKAPSTIVEGIENAPQALMDILRPNATIGKVCVRIG